MRYKSIIAFLGKNQMKDWATPISRLIIFEDVRPDYWKSLIKAYPDEWKFQLNNPRLARVDGASFPWCQMIKSYVYMQNKIKDLGQESDLYIYDTVTKAIIFNNDSWPKEKLEERLPLLEEFLDRPNNLAGENSIEFK
jgi:hypothetical protein